MKVTPDLALSPLIPLLLLLTGCAEPGPRQKLAPQTSPDRARFSSAVEFEKMAIGLCEDYPEESRTLALATRDLHLLQTNDIRYLRIAFGWDAMEPAPGKYDWSFWDEFVVLASERYGITLLPYICYTPSWAASVQDQDSWRRPPKNNELFASFVATLVTRYKHHIHSWELWNEPDNQHYWLGTVEEYAALLQAGSQAVRKADPNAKIVLGGLAWDLNFLNDLAELNALKHVDVVNLHNYYETWSDDPLEQITSYVGKASDRLRMHNLDLPIWMAELGYSSYRSNNWVSGQYQALHPAEHTDTHQATALFRAMVLLLHSGQVELAAWYRINDLPSSQEVIGDVNNRHLGVLDNRGNPKPALQALRFFNQLFSEGYKEMDSQIRLTHRLGVQAHVYAFATPGGKTVIAGWLPTRTPGDVPSPGPVTDTPVATVLLQMPALPGFQATLHTETGEIVKPVKLEKAGKDRARVQLHLANTNVSVLVVETGDTTALRY